MAGLNRLKHKVDCVMLILSNDETPERIMRVTKNRFGQSHKTMKLYMRGEDEKFPGRLYPVEELRQGRKAGKVVRKPAADRKFEEVKGKAKTRKKC